MREERETSRKKAIQSGTRNGWQGQLWKDAGQAASGEGCRLLWRTAPEGWLERAGRLRSPGQFPWLVEESELENRIDGARETFERTPAKMAGGILLSPFEPQRFRWDEARHGSLRAFLLLALEDLWQLERFGPFGPGAQALEQAALQRRKGRPMLSARLLAGAHLLLPENDALRARLLLETWEVLELAPREEKRETLQFLDRLFRGMDPGRIDRLTREKTRFVHRKVLACLGRQKESRAGSLRVEGVVPPQAVPSGGAKPRGALVDLAVVTDLNQAAVNNG